MAILPTVLQTLNGVSGGVNGNMAVQVLGSVPIDFGSENVVSVYSPILNSGAHIVVLDAVVRMPNGPPQPSTNGYPLQISIRLQSTQIIIINLNPFGLGTTIPTYSHGDLQGALPLNPNPTITAAMIVPSTASKMGFVDVIGYGASAS